MPAAPPRAQVTAASASLGAGVTPAAEVRNRRTVPRSAHGILGIAGKPLTPGILDGNPLVALLVAHDARISVEC